MPALSLTLHDSEIAAVDHQHDAITLRFAAARVAWVDDAGQRLQGFCTGLGLSLTGAALVQRAGTPFGRITHAELLLDARPLATLPSPGEWQGDVRLRLHGSDHWALDLTAGRFATTLAPGSTLHEAMAC